MTSSAVATSSGGTVRPSALAVFMLITSSNFSGVNAGLAEDGLVVDSVIDQAAGRSEPSAIIDRRNGMARCQRHDLLSPLREELVAADDEPVGLQLGEGEEGGVDLAFGACPHDR